MQIFNYEVPTQRGLGPRGRPDVIPTVARRPKEGTRQHGRSRSRDGVWIAAAQHDDDKQCTAGREGERTRHRRGRGVIRAKIRVGVLRTSQTFQLSCGAWQKKGRSLLGGKIGSSLVDRLHCPISLFTWRERGRIREGGEQGGIKEPHLCHVRHGTSKEGRQRAECIPFPHCVHRLPTLLVVRRCSDASHITHAHSAQMHKYLH